jgi:hypothetical protein
MHDRYFFCADVLTLILAMVSPEAFAMPILVQFGSLLGYYAYLNMRYLMPMSMGGIAMLAAAVMAGLYYHSSARPCPPTGKNNRNAIT